jgi:hypothetical protein
MSHPRRLVPIPIVDHAPFVPLLEKTTMNITLQQHSVTTTCEFCCTLLSFDPVAPLGYKPSIIN